MKLRQLSLLLSALFLGACANLDRLDDIQQRYAQVAVGMTEPEVIAKLGSPNERRPAGQAMWRQQADARNYVVLRVRFDDSGVVRGKSIFRHKQSDPIPDGPSGAEALRQLEELGTKPPQPVRNP